MTISSETIKELDENKEIENLKKIEAAFFLSARFLSLKELVLLTDINPLMLRELIEKLVQKYNNQESAIEIISKENMWKMDVGQEYIHMVNKLATGSSEFTKAEQETLAVIAYKQPVKQSIIIKIRGNKAYDHIKNFITIGLLHAKQIGHTKELRLSDDFFDYFHLQNNGKVAVLNDPEESEQSEDSSDLTKGDGGAIELEANNIEEGNEEIENLS
jgi:segregation and condensation protein B